MIPELEISHLSREFAYKKVEEWIQLDYPSLESNNSNLGECLPPEYGTVLLHENQRRIIAKKNEKERKKTLEEEIFRIYNIILNILGGDKFKVSTRYNWDDIEKSNIIRELQCEGYRVDYFDFYDIIKIAESVKENKTFTKPFELKKGENFRHASLNCFDYERLKDEMRCLETIIGITKIKKECKTLYNIYMEALNNENSDYPGRHLPYNRIGGIRSDSAQRYQYLRMIDEILCSNTDNRFFTFEQMEAEIRKLAKYYGIQYQKNRMQNWIDFENYSFTPSQFKHAYNILKQLICIEHTSGKTTTYERNVFDTEQKSDATSGKFKESGALRYKTLTNGRKRLSAFTVDISVHEISLLRKEIGTVRAKYFGDERENFASMFPLIATLGYTEEIALDQDFGEEMLYDINQTDLKLVVYKSLKYAELKKKIKEVISLQLPISIKKGDEWQTVYPMSIKEDSGKWTVIAKAENINRPILISPEILEQTFETHSESFKVDGSFKIENHFIGTGDFIMDDPQDIVLELTYAGMKEVDNKKSVFMDLSPTIEWTFKRKTDGYRRAGLIRLNHVYINEDFLHAVFRLDCTGKLRSIEPECVRSLYKDYFVKWAGQEWRHIDDRPLGNKYIKIKKSKLFE